MEIFALGRDSVLEAFWAVPATCVLQPHWGMKTSQGRKLWFSLLSLDHTVTEENLIIYASLYVLERLIPLAGWSWSLHTGLTGCRMQLLYWDDFQSEPFDNGAVELTCPFGTAVTPMSFCRERGGRHVSQIGDGTKRFILFSSLLQMEAEG